MNYIIGTGWWCADPQQDTRDVTHGDDLIRASDFHNIWYTAVDAFTAPTKIFITDSNSPIVPDLNLDDSRIEFVTLPLNSGHSTNHIGKYCGWTRSVLLGLEYAMQSQADYFVYVEQDVLLYGEGIIERCIQSMRTGLMFGGGDNTPQPLQQSFFIIKCDNARLFLRRLHQIAQSDGTLSPEIKFAIAASSLPVSLLVQLAMTAHATEVINWLEWQLRDKFPGFDKLPIGYGRVRPINFGDEHYYFQHGTVEEIGSYLEKLEHEGHR